MWLLLQTLQVSSTSFYDWLTSESSGKTKAKREAELQKGEEAKKLFMEHKKSIGSRRMAYAMTKGGDPMGRKSARRMMRQNRLVVRRKRLFVRTTDSKHSEPISPNLLQRDFTSERPNEIWVGDITYLPTKQGFVYLATWIDLYSRKVVGHSVYDHMRASLVTDTLRKAIVVRQPARGVIVHTDRGSQYASGAFRDLLKLHGMTQSMSGKGNCYDNAAAETFFSTLKKELCADKVFEDLADAQFEVWKYIEGYYNRKRMHSYLKYLSPCEFEDNFSVKQVG